MMMDHPIMVTMQAFTVPDRLGQASMIAAKSGVHRDVPPGALVGGYPAMEAALWRRVVALLPKLPDVLRRLRRAEKAISRLEREGE